MTEIPNENTQPQEAQAAPAQTDAQINFGRLRKQLEQERSEKTQLQQRLEQLERINKIAIQQAIQPNHDDDDDDGDDPYVDHKALKRKFSRWEQNLEEKIEQKAAQKAAELMEKEKQNQYIRANPDFYEVMTEQNLDAFARKHPAIADRMLMMPDNFHRQALLYEQIKALQAPKKDERPAVQDQIDRNRKGMFYHPSGVGSAPYNNVGDFSTQGQKSAYEKMQELKKRISM